MCTSSGARNLDPKQCLAASSPLMLTIGTGIIIIILGGSPLGPNLGPHCQPIALSRDSHSHVNSPPQPPLYIW